MTDLYPNPPHPNQPPYPNLPPQPWPGSAPKKKAGLKWALAGLAAVVVVALVATAGFFVFRGDSGDDSSKVSPEEAGLTQEPATPLGASLATKRGKPIWTLPKGEIGISDKTIVGGTEKYALSGGISVRGNIATLGVIDAETGAELRKVELARGVRTAIFKECATARSGQVAACELDETVFIVDLDAGRVVGRIAKAAAPVAASDGFWADGKTSSEPLAAEVVSIGADGRERWRSASDSVIPVVAGSGVVPVDTERGDKDPMTTEFKRDTDGKVVEVAESGSSRLWAPFVGGFALGSDRTEEGVTTIYDLNGTKLSTTEPGWMPVEMPGYTTEYPTSPSLPVVERSVEKGSETSIASLNPRTGRPLWTRAMPVKDRRATEVVGIGTAIMAVDMLDAPNYQVLVADAYLGGYESVAGAKRGPKLLATDGKHVLLGTEESEKEQTVTAYSADGGGPLWSYMTESYFAPQTYGGKVYVGGSRLI
ncbi:hypothetical protein HUN08_10840 [Gordonia sp. X0973]|uniref:hypothetical protein n=1 Tax=Gordonia sp. X0973 TaxID=2742602 RepID=UPI000F534CE3|nr:hypothetical protein [Gordonia sp. X0973]QKT07635.1 hypothetical protein HUN08_10840 [Gordonia sp. X0973]